MNERTVVKQMIDYISGFENKLVVAFTTADTVGTRNTIKLAQKNNIPVVEIPYTAMHDNRAFAMELNGVSSHNILKIYPINYCNDLLNFVNLYHLIQLIILLSKIILLEYILNMNLLLIQNI